jgi:uncharacterized protein YndB with AHSA1/START domain
MNILLIIVSILVGLIFLVAIIGWCLPRYTKMQRSIIFNSTPEAVFPYLESLKMFVEHWSPWTDKDANMTATFNAVESGEGAVYEWKGDRKKVGSGRMSIVKVFPNEKVETVLEFQGQGQAEVNMIVKPITETTVEVIWDFKSDNKNSPVARIFGAMMDKFLGPDFEKGLEKLKETVEA